MRRSWILTFVLSLVSAGATVNVTDAQQNFYPNQYHRPVRLAAVQSASFNSFAEGDSVADGLKDLQEDLEKQSEALKKQSEATEKQTEAFEKQTKAIEKQNKKNEEEFEGLSEDMEAFDKDLEELTEGFEGIEESIEEQGDEIGDIEKALKGKVDTGSSVSSVKLYGRVHADYWGFPGSDAGIAAIEGNPDGPQDQLGFRRMRFGVSGKLPANMVYKIEMEFAGGNNSEFRDAYLGWDHLPFLHRLLVGNQKRPYGLDHLNSSRYNVFLERPFIIESFNQDARRFGIQSYGVSEDQSWNWRYGVFNQRLIQDEGIYRNDHLQLEFAARIANTFWYDEASDGRGYGHWAFSGSLANPDGLAGGNNEARFRHRPEARSQNRWLDTGRIVGADDYQLGGVEGVLNFGALQLVGEYQGMALQRQPGFGDDLNFHGGYVQAAYFLTGEHMPWDRRSGTLGRIKPFEDAFRVRTDCGIGRGLGAWQVAARVSRGDLLDGNILGGIGNALTIGMNWYWNSNARMQFNYIDGDIENNRGNSGDYKIVGMRFMVDF